MKDSIVLKYFAIIIILIVGQSMFFNACTPTKIPVELKYINFDNATYSSTVPNDIKVYNSRYELPEKFIEIGTIKFKGEPELQSVLELAAKHGAMALIKEANNYVLIRFQNINQRSESNAV